MLFFFGGGDILGKFVDLTGMRYGRLTVAERGPDHRNPKTGYVTVQWWCDCDCGKRKLVKACDLRNGHTRSCGCLHKEVAEKTGRKKKGKNQFIVNGDIVVGITAKGDKFYFDKEDFEKVSEFNWWKDKQGYITTKHNSERIKLHRLVMNAAPDEQIDHINHQLENACKNNLRRVTKQQNAYNSKMSTRNTSGVKGVCYVSKWRKWIAQIGLNGKTIRLGTFDSFEEAVAARKAAEEKYFGDYSYDNSMAASPVIEVA